MQRLLPTALIAVTVVACDGAASYRGDGKLIDNGFAAASERYVLDLGPVDLGKQLLTTYKLSGLPNEEFTVGIRTQSTKTPDGKSLFDAKPLRAKVRLELTSEKSGKVFEIADDLPSWTWSEVRDLHIFLYGRGDKRQPTSTSFTPRPGESYRLAFEILSPDPAATQYRFSLLAVGGGWK